MQKPGSPQAMDLISPTLIQTGYGQLPRVPGLDKPLGTAIAGGAKYALVSAVLAKHYTGVVGSCLDNPIGTVTASDHHSLVTSNLVKLRGTCRDVHPVTEPMATESAQGLHLAEVRPSWSSISEPTKTLAWKSHIEALLRVGNDSREEWMIADIGLRMLTPRELYRAKGFPENYTIAPGFRGKLLSKPAQVRMVGNSVCPPLAAAMARAQFGVQSMEIAA